MSEATSALADPNNPAGQWRYVADELPQVDFAEAAGNARREAYRKKYKDADMDTLIFPVRRVERRPPNPA